MIYPIRVVQRRLNGITRMRAGIRSTNGTDLILDTRKPAAIVRIPPQAERSANMAGVSTPASSLPAPKTMNRMMTCGMGIAQMAAPSVEAKIIAVKKSSTAFDISSDGSPVMPSVSVLYQPKPLQQNSATAVM